MSEDQHKKGQKRKHPKAVFKMFGEYSDHEPKEVHKEMLASVSNDFNYYRNVSWLNMQMHKQVLSKWVENMRNPNVAVDEFAIYVLLRLYNHHSVIYTKGRVWSTTGTSKPMSEKELYMACDVCFVYMGPNNFISLIKKPITSMPVLPMQALENVYEGGYFENISTVSDTGNTLLETSKERANIIVTSDADTTPCEYCAVHGCNVTEEVKNEHTSTTEMIELHSSSITFPTASSVCETLTTSTLQKFNPLEESEPNLDLYMTNPSEKTELEVVSPSEKMRQEALTRKYIVPVRNLKPKEIKFLAGPYLLPNITRTAKESEIAPMVCEEEPIVSVATESVSATLNNVTEPLIKIASLNKPEVANVRMEPFIVSGGSRIFPGGVPTSKVGVVIYYFCQKLHENERIWTPRGGTCPWCPPWIHQ